MFVTDIILITIQVLLGLQVYWASCLFSLYQQTRSGLTIRITTR